MNNASLYGSAPALSPNDERKALEDFRLKSLPEQLRIIASGMVNHAKQFNGCTWMGTFPPGYIDIIHAGILEEAAKRLEDAEPK